MKAIACTVEQDRPGTGRALVNGKQLRGFCHQANSVIRATYFPGLKNSDGAPFSPLLRRFRGLPGDG
jgi:hypothetical protein